MEDLVNHHQMEMKQCLPYTVDTRMHSEEITDLGTFSSDTTNEAFRKTS